MSLCKIYLILINIYYFGYFLACWRITIDGGTDKWFDFVNQHSLSLSLPNCVTGDFDSIKPETLEFCEQQDEIIVINTPDQNFTDFDKAVDVLIKKCPHEVCIFVFTNFISLF